MVWHGGVWYGEEYGEDRPTQAGTGQWTGAGGARRLCARFTHQREQVCLQYTTHPAPQYIFPCFLLAPTGAIYVVIHYHTSAHKTAAQNLIRSIVISVAIVISKQARVGPPRTMGGAMYQTFSHWPQTLCTLHSLIIIIIR